MSFQLQLIQNKFSKESMEARAQHISTFPHPEHTPQNAKQNHFSRLKLMEHLVSA